VAGVVGAACAVLACTGLATLPARGWAVALILVAMLAFAVDVQVGIPRFWTGVGIVLTTFASLVLFEPLPGTTLRPSWITLVAGIGGVVLAFVVGMPSMVRTRFATPTIGREWMIGELGDVVDAVDPDGIVSVGDARWRARTNRATPVAAGQQVRVVAIDGVTLEVEPLEGAARDHRERRRKGSGDDAVSAP
jgi:membrane-bound serine protease (ClpP class)